MAIEGALWRYMIIGCAIIIAFRFSYAAIMPYAADAMPLRYAPRRQRAMRRCRHYATYHWHASESVSRERHATIPATAR